MNYVRKLVVLLSFTLYTLLFAQIACARNNPAKYIQSISTKAQKDNVLRMDVEINFKKALDYTVEYWKADAENFIQKTRLHHSDKGKTKTTLVFLEANSKYNFKVIVHKGKKRISSNAYPFTTPLMPSDVPEYTMEMDSLPREVPGYLILGRSHQKPGYLTIINTAGKVVWYQNMGDELVLVADFDTIHQTIQCNIGRQRGDKYTGKYLQVMDLYGNILLRKDVTSMYVHHETRRMPDGNLLMVNYVPKQFDLTSQGGTANETVFGDGFTIMDMSGNVLYQWDCFGEKNPAQEPQIMLNAVHQWDDDKGHKKYNLDLGKGMSENLLKDDWLHANSVNYDAEGNFYISFNNLSEIWKVNKETKKVVYRLGAGGNLTMLGSNSMSGVHCVNVLEKDKLLFLDNGCKTQHSKVWECKIDEQAKTAEMKLMIELPTSLSTVNRGGVNLIENKYLIINSTTSNSILFTDLDGRILRILKTPHQTYRANYIPPFDY